MTYITYETSGESGGWVEFEWSASVSLLTLSSTSSLCAYFADLFLGSILLMEVVLGTLKQQVMVETKLRLDCSGLLLDTARVLGSSF